MVCQMVQDMGREAAACDFPYGDEQFAVARESLHQFRFERLAEPGIRHCDPDAMLAEFTRGFEAGFKP